VKGHSKKKRWETAKLIEARPKSHRASVLSSRETGRDHKRNGEWLITALFVAIAVALAMNNSPEWLPQILPKSTVEPASSAASAAGIRNVTSNQTSEQLLRGRWVRPDGGYLIELANAQPDGRLEVRYFNPRPVNVSRAEWQRGDDGLHVFVELRQANYPGATYNLRYLPATDQLAGDYFQPLYQQTFRVYFLRKSP
jgi:hypothetical protein